MKSKESGTQWLLLTAVFVIATCGLIYELVAGTLASYLLGDSVTQFSTIIGVYLFSMGIGSFLSSWFDKSLLSWFIRIELLVGLIGGFSAAVLFVCFPLANGFRFILYGFVVITGILVGLEIPLLMRILKDRVEFKDLVSRVFTFDYIHAGLVFHLQDADGAAGHDHAAGQGEGGQHQHVHRIAVTGQGLGHVPVVAGVVHGGAHEAIDKHAAGFFIDFVLDRVGIGGNFNHHVKGFRGIFAGGDFFERHADHTREVKNHGFRKTCCLWMPHENRAF
jgi:hypothetical protein